MSVLMPPDHKQIKHEIWRQHIYGCLDVELYRSAVFYAERYFAIFRDSPEARDSHEARHIYATTLLRSGQPHSAFHLVNLPKDQACNVCYEVKAKCCTALGRHRKAREALEQCNSLLKQHNTGMWPTCYLSAYLAQINMSLHGGVDYL